MDKQLSPRINLHLHLHLLLLLLLVDLSLPLLLLVHLLLVLARLQTRIDDVMLGNDDHNNKCMEIWLAFKHEKAML